MHECSQQFIHNCQKLENMPFNGWLNKHWYIHTMEYNSEIEQILDILSCLGESQENYWVKDGNPSLHATKFYLDNILEMMKLQKWRTG